MTFMPSVAAMTATSTRTPRNMREICLLMMRHITRLKMSISGARTAMRRIIWNAFCTFVQSVVIRVMRPAVLNLSMFENE